MKKTIHTSTHYQVGLGSAFLNRARIIFALLIILVVGLFGTAVYTEARTNELGNLVASPIRYISNGLAKMYENAVTEEDSSFYTDFTRVYESTSSGSFNVDHSVTIINGQKVEDTDPTPKTTTAPKRTAPTIQYQTTPQSTQNNDEWFKRVQEENDRWFAEQSAKNAAESKAKYEQNVKDAQAKQDTWWAQQQAEHEQWKKDHGL